MSDDIVICLREALPVVITLMAVCSAFLIAGRIFHHAEKKRGNLRFTYQVVKIFIFLIGVVSIIIALPISESKQGYLFSLIGIVTSAAIALSSTNFLGNTMAGFLLRAVRSFRTGDFIVTQNYSGRVSERGLMHTEIQTEERTLVTFPNLYLVTNPVTVVRSSGTVISAAVSLGYDINHYTVEKHLISAAEKSGLTDPFVHIVELGDFSITYRISGMLSDVKHLLRARSELREKMLDVLHENKIEIVSPGFMNQRVFDSASRFIPPEAAYREIKQTDDLEVDAEKMIFDKAEEAENLEMLEKKKVELIQKIEEKEKEKKSQDEESRKEVEKSIERYKNWIEIIDRKIEEKKSGEKK